MSELSQPSNSGREQWHEGQAITREMDFTSTDEDVLDQAKCDQCNHPRELAGDGHDEPSKSKQAEHRSEYCAQSAELINEPI